MQNNISNALNQLWQQEQAAGREVDDREAEANEALGRLHGALEKYYTLKQEEKAALLDVQDFIANVQEKVVKVNLPELAHKRAEAQRMLETASWAISGLLDIVKDIEYTIKNNQ